MRITQLSYKTNPTSLRKTVNINADYKSFHLFFNILLWYRNKIEVVPPAMRTFITTTTCSLSGPLTGNLYDRQSLISPASTTCLYVWFSNQTDRHLKISTETVNNELTKSDIAPTEIYECGRLSWTQWQSSDRKRIPTVANPSGVDEMTIVILKVGVSKYFVLRVFGGLPSQKIGRQCIEKVFLSFVLLPQFQSMNSKISSKLFLNSPARFFLNAPLKSFVSTR